MNFELIFKLSLFVSGSLFSLAVLLTAGLMISKIVRRGWARYTSSREEIYKAPILHAISSESNAVLELLFRHKRRWGDWKIVEHSLLKWAQGLRGYGHQKLCEIFDQNGFADYEIRNLKSIRWWVRARAAQRLGQMLCVRASSPLIGTLQDHSLEVRLMASWALGRLKDPKAVDPIVQSLAHYSKLAALRATNIILTMGHRTVPILEGLLQNPDRDVQVLAIDLLGVLKERQATDQLIPFLNAKNLDTRVAACRALGNIEDEKAGPSVARCLQDPAWQVRSKAAFVVGQLGYVQAIPDLKRTMGDKFWWVRLHSGEALSRLGGQGQKALQETLSSEDRFARDMAAQWLDELAASNL
ncbi:MAG: HEAT repeat domain-containing protein [Elusimicrobia bacterium]|nr:HEAT repeat domain-containing protein [Elusimicrobiota bacterium]